MSGQPGQTGQGRDVAAVDTAVRPRLLIVDGDTDAAAALTEVLGACAAERSARQS